MQDMVYLSNTPLEEDCVQVNPNANYMPAMRKEVNRMKLLAEKIWPEARFSIRSCPHDFGTYLELVSVFNDESKKETDLAYSIEGQWPKTWEEAEEWAAAGAPPPLPKKKKRKSTN